MASLDFPSNPTNGQTYALNGVTYYYNSSMGAWLTQLTSMNLSTSSNTQVLFNDAGIANGSSGLTYNKAANTVFANTINVNTMVVTGNLQIGTGTTTITGSSINVNSVTVTKNLDMSLSSGYISLPKGSSAQRPGSASVGMLRYNTDTDALENYTSNTGWTKVSIPIPSITSSTGTIYSGATSTLTLTGINFGTSANVTFKVSGSTVATSAVTPTSQGTSISVSVPSAVYGQASSTTVSITVTNVDNGVSNSIDKTVAALPSGGTITTSGNYRIHAFYTSGTFTNTISGLAIDYMIIAGGGGGGCLPGGGGAGGYLAGSTTASVTSYTATVGGGGVGGAQNVAGGSGSNSSCLGLTAVGGGGGGSHYSGSTSVAGTSGGSGGGGSDNNNSYGPGSGTAGQGNAGGNGCPTYGSDPRRGGGGGGAGAVGSAYNAGGHGGAGVENSILGTSYYWAGGGGGAGYSGNAGNGGQGGGGGGAPKVGGGGLAGTGGLNAGTDGEVGTLVSQTNKKGGAGGTNTGSGGGGGSHYNLTNDGGSGGSGIVVIRYAGSQKAIGGTVTTVGSDTVHTYYSTGTFVAYADGLNITSTSIYWGDSITITYYNSSLSNGTTVAYTISGVTSSQINGDSLSGNFVMSNGLASVTLTTTRTGVDVSTLTLSISGSSISCDITYLTSFTGSIGASWGSQNLTYTAATVGLANLTSIPYTISGANVTSQQLSNISLSGTFTNIVTSFLGSTYFDGSGDYLSIPNGSAFQFGTGDFTIEFWIKTTDASFDIINQYASGGTNWSLLVVSGSLYWQNSNASSSLYYIGLTSLPANPTSGSWTHVALTRTSGTVKYWLNGTGASTTTADGTNYSGGASEIRIGSGYYGDFLGNISNLRDRKSTRLNSSHTDISRMPSSA